MFSDRRRLPASIWIEPRSRSWRSIVRLRLVGSLSDLLGLWLWLGGCAGCAGTGGKRRIGERLSTQGACTPCVHHHFYVPGIGWTYERMGGGNRARHPEHHLGLHFRCVVFVVVGH